MYIDLKDIPNYDDWIKIEKINKGWSDDIKFYLEDKGGGKYLLRINSIEKFESKENEFRIIKKYNKLNFEMSKAITSGICNNGKNVYMIFSWVEGAALDNVLSKLDEEEQFKLGIKAGEILKSIHNIKVDKEDLPEETKIRRKLQQLKRYEDSLYRIPNDEYIVKFIKDNIHKTCIEEPVYEHGDFHPGNLIYTLDKRIGVIDFNRLECGDRYEEFYKIQILTIEQSIPFAIGQIKGYFRGEPPKKFWEIQKIYVAHASLFSIEWAVKFGKNDINAMIKRCYKARMDYENFKLLIPKWYSENVRRF
ncbi:aminoglycoside phosphotransferase family protein [Clostridium cellulovorans]|uniref:Aminoglycoside phosphotransferase n=1 Tax=Clostridium cellulovorans (strain ATCC 35296 / DSM 3052 / OCM 3 / 743B) TaxID=573061 RepID=D9SX61_CLOC7|nr:phosphotransferase [Clostridium cellulovorans]ADL53364.1 aminoglycoside phosphotransferase [Clostridium cellulovorans 743B]